MKFAVTGGAGFLGSHVSNYLAENGHSVTAIDDCSTGSADELDDRVEFVEASVLDADILPSETDVVFHFAAPSPYTHQDNPTQGARVMVEGFVNVVEQAEATECDSIVYASTAELYRTRNDSSSSGGNVTAVTNREAAHLSRERYAQAYGQTSCLDIVGLRLATVYGVGEEHKGEYASEVSQFVDAIANGCSPVIHEDGHTTRAFTYVDDVARAFEAAVGLTGVYNVGSRCVASLDTLVQSINELLDTDVSAKRFEGLDGEARDDMPLPDSSSFRAETGWSAEFTFIDGLSRVCDEYR